MADIFDEISDDLRAERMQALLRRYGVALVALVVLLIAGVLGLQAWRSHQAQQTDQVAAAYLGAVRQATAPAAASGGGAAQPAEAAFASLAGTAPEGYRTLARLRDAALRAGGGQLPAALALWDQVAGDASVDPLLRELANLLWAQHQVDQGDPAAVEARLVPLVGPGSVWGPLAKETQALLALRTGQPGRARDILRQLQGEPAAPDGVRGRAAGLLSQLGEAPAAPAVDKGVGG